MERHNTRLIFLGLAVPSVLFVVVKALQALAMLPGPTGRVLGLLGGQPGATVVLVSAVAAALVALDRVQVSSGTRRLALKLSAVAGVFVVAGLGFARLYVNEYGWLY